MSGQPQSHPQSQPSQQSHPSQQLQQLQQSPQPGSQESQQSQQSCRWQKPWRRWRLNGSLWSQQSSWQVQAIRAHTAHPASRLRGRGGFSPGGVKPGPCGTHGGIGAWPGS